MIKASRKKVFVGLSGGVDSSVSAALLKKAGYEVTGVFIRVWQPEWLPCSWRDDRRDAMRVAANLNIPFLTLNLEKEYKKEVIDSMLRDYKAGRTPNPDVLCNKEIKFGAFFRHAVKMGADYVATGHYARIATNNLQLTTYNLLAAVDAAKDQSYFLWTLNQEILSRTFFPIGGFKKEKVRKLAQKFDLPTSEKKDSQGLCFIGELDMKEFLSHYIKPKRGTVLNEEGRKIGFHDGAWLFTYGERHGFTITEKTAKDAPLYVVKKNVAKNTITVGPKEKIGEATSGRIKLMDVNWVSGSAPASGKGFFGALRYHATPINVSLVGVTGGKADLSAENQGQPVVPGQSLVIYDKGVCLGGGVIG